MTKMMDNWLNKVKKITVAGFIQWVLGCVGIYLLYGLLEPYISGDISRGLLAALLFITMNVVVEILLEYVFKKIKN